MRKVTEFLKANIPFFVIIAISLAFYLLAIFGGDYQTTTFFTEVTHYQFTNGDTNGVGIAILFVVAPLICFIAIIILNIFKPKKRDGKRAVLFVALFIAIATIAGALLVLIPFALFNQCAVEYKCIVDWKALKEDVYYIKTFNFPLLSMVLSLISLMVLGCYTSATLSE